MALSNIFGKIADRQDAVKLDAEAARISRRAERDPNSSSRGEDITTSRNLRARAEQLRKR